VSAPRFSVILPVRNGAATIGQQLAALAAQEIGTPWELLVVDNGSTDATRQVAEAWRDRLPLTLIDAAGRPGISHTRNTGAAAARADLLLFCDSDDVVQPGWAMALVEGLAEADVVGGRTRDDLLGGLEKGGGAPWREAHPADRLPSASGGPAYAPGANFAVRRRVVEALGGWDSTIPAAEDIDFSWRAQQAGFRLGFAPRAVVAYRQRSTARQVASQSFAYGRSRRRLQSRHRQAIPSRLGPALGVLRAGIDLSIGLLVHPGSRRGRLQWVRWMAYLLGWLLPGRAADSAAAVPSAAPLQAEDHEGTAP
jgi:glycosyltransferase involved in cell wall biosynthesis